MSLKGRISSPLEAGTSILDAHHLPSHIVPALEYVSTKLASKGLHLTLVVVRRDYQLPAVLPPVGAPGLPAGPTSPHLSSSRLGFTAASLSSPSPVAALKQLVRSGSGRTAQPIISPPSSAVSFSSASSQTTTPSLSSSSSITANDNPWLLWPRTPATPMSLPPTPSTASSGVTADSANAFFGPVSPGIMRLVHTTTLTATEEKHLRNTLFKAERKFNLEGSCLSPTISPAGCGLTMQLIQSSIVQNEILFSSEGLTLLSLDRLYSLKSALSSYSKTRYPLRLEDAVDELRRLVLANNGCKVTRSDLLRSHDWLSVSHSSIVDLDRMYRRAYGGPEGVGAISGLTKKDNTAPFRPLPSPLIVHTDDEVEEGQRSWLDDIIDEDDLFASDTIQVCKPPTPRGPTLKLQTSFDKPPRLPANGNDEDDQDSDRTPRAGAETLPIMLQPWNGSSIDQMLSATDMTLSPGVRDSTRLGPATPNGYDDISPITRGEWGFLMVDKPLEGCGRTVAVETW